MNRQQYRFAIRELDKQLVKWEKYMQKLNIARATAPTEKLRLDAETSLMVLSQQVYELLTKRKNLVMAFEATRSIERPSGAEEDIPDYPMGEQIF